MAFNVHFIMLHFEDFRMVLKKNNFSFYAKVKKNLSLTLLYFKNVVRATML